MQNLKIALLQSDLIWENIVQNLENFEQKFETIIPGTDVVVLPEMFTTGFSMNPAQFAQKSFELGLDWMKKMAFTYNYVIAGSLMIPENNGFKNRFYWVEPNGTINYYDKKHLFSMGNEHHSYEAGNKQVVFMYKDWKIMPAICYDIRFPVWCRNTVAYDLLLVVANWPERRIAHWNALLLARAIENQSYVAAVNRIGFDGNGINHSGNSQIIGPDGLPLVSVNSDCSIIYQTLYKQNLLEVRQKLPFLKDQDAFVLT